VRTFLPAYRDLAALEAIGSLEPHAAVLLRHTMTRGRSIPVSGATHAGKTTLLAVLVVAIPPSHRVVMVEGTFELASMRSTSSPYQTAAEPRRIGRGDAARLMMEALRMRPDRLVVGEVRDVEALDFLLALTPTCRFAHRHNWRCYKTHKHHLHCV